MKVILFAFLWISVSHAAVYFAQLEGFGNGIGSVKGRVRVYTTDGSRHSDLVAYSGVVNGVSTNLKPINCTDTNACGAHIHSGKSCESVELQEGHLYNGTEVDPWLVERYKSDSNGIGRFGGVVDMGTNDIDGRAFVVHNETGGRIACGILTKINTGGRSTFMCPPFATIRRGVRVLRGMNGCRCLKGFERQRRTCASVACGDYTCPKHSKVKDSVTCLRSIRDCVCDEGYKKKGGYCMLNLRSRES